MFNFSSLAKNFGAAMAASDAALPTALGFFVVFFFYQEYAEFAGFMCLISGMNEHVPYIWK